MNLNNEKRRQKVQSWEEKWILIQAGNPCQDLCECVAEFEKLERNLEIKGEIGI